MPVIETEPRGAGGSSPHRATGGFSGAAALVLITVVTVVAALLSAGTGRGFGLAFNLVFLLVTLYAALRVHVEDRFVTVVAPPLIYALALILGGYVDSEESVRTFQRVVENTFVNLSFGAPWLVGTTVATIVIAIVRGRRATLQRH